MTEPTVDIQFILEGCKANDRRAQEQLYNMFYRALGSLCLRYTQNREDAIELLHDGFLKIFKNLAQYDSAKAGLFAWMKKIVLHTVIDHLRRKKMFFVEMQPQHMEEEDLDNATMEKMNAEHLLLLIRNLPRATQLVFNLYSAEGYSHTEIAGMLNISESTSRWHLSEARKTMKAQLLSNRKIT